MKPLLAICAVAAGLAVPLNAADPGAERVPPQALPASRYEKLARQNPFILPTAAPVAPVSVKNAPKWSDGLTAVTVMQQGDTYLATVYDRNTNERFTVGTDPDVKNSHDIALASVRWADKVDETTVTLRKGSEFSPVKYDPGSGGAPLAGAPSAGAPGGAAANPGRTPMNPGAVANRLPTPIFNNPPVQPPSPNMIRRQTPIRATPPPNPAVGGGRLPANAPAPRTQPGIRPPPGNAIFADDDDDE